MSASTSASASMLPDNLNKIIFEAKHYGLKFLTRFNNHDFQNSLPNPTPKYLFPTISRKLTPFLWTKPQNTCMEAEARSRSCFQENLMSASALASAPASTSTSMLSDKFNKIINEEQGWPKSSLFLNQPGGLFLGFF